MGWLPGVEVLLIIIIIIKIGNNTIIGETSVTKYLGIHLDKRLDFKNHMKVLS